ncbi:MAG: YibE/F family protein [Clostridiales Family XIII bacterium]|jgi:uncharacterized membrane protein|nr:YibE/F family protein [Clostridiales Family XIII bacterium]
MKINKSTVGIISYIAIALSAILLLYVGNKVAVGGLPGADADDSRTVEAEITRIIADGGETVSFEAAIKNGAGREYVIGTQDVSEYYLSGAKSAETGDRVILSGNPGGEWRFVDYVRIRGILLLGGVFILLLVLFGRIKGVNAILSLCLTCVSVFAVFLPAFLSGKNIYVFSVLVCVFSIITTLFVVNGVSMKSMAAVAGCLGGVAAICVLTLAMNKALNLTGALREDTMYLLNLPTGDPVNMRAVIFAGIVIGAVGAVMDVAMTISSSLWELKSQAPELEFSSIFKSGVNIGQDVMGTMTNTLILAYIGSSLSLLLLLVVYVNSLTELLNSDSVVIEMLQAVIGSFGILLTMPLTAFVCAMLYSRAPGGRKVGVNEQESL